MGCSYTAWMEIGLRQSPPVGEFSVVDILVIYLFHRCQSAPEQQIEADLVRSRTFLETGEGVISLSDIAQLDQQEGAMTLRDVSARESRGDAGRQYAPVL